MTKDDTLSPLPSDGQNSLGASQILASNTKIIKANLRRQARETRYNLFDSPEKRQEAELRIMENFFKLVTIKPNRLIGFYKAIAGEVSTDVFCKFVWDKKGKIALPRVMGKTRPLSYFLYNEGDELETLEFGTRSPYESSMPVVPDILGVPMLAYTPELYRLGYGGGYFDKTLAFFQRSLMKPPLAYGLAFAGQVTTEFVHEAFDIKMDAVVTENGVIWPA